MEHSGRNAEGMVLAAALLTSVCLFSSAARADLASAEASFKSKCAMCHGAEGKGKESLKTRNLGSAEVQKQTDAELSAIIIRGKASRMPAYKSMSPGEVKDMIKYIRSLKK